MIEALLIVAGLVAGVAPALLIRRRRDEPAAPSSGRILIPHVGTQLSISALDAALRIARVEQATLVPAYLAPVPMALPPMPRTCTRAFELQEAIEHRGGRPPPQPVSPCPFTHPLMREALAVCGSRSARFRRPARSDGPHGPRGRPVAAL